MNSANKMVWSIIAAASIATGSYFGTMSLSSQHALGDTASQTAKQTTTPQPETVAPANELSRAFRSVHNALKDAVVNINITKKVALSGGALFPCCTDAARPAGVTASTTGIGGAVMRSVS